MSESKHVRKFKELHLDKGDSIVATAEGYIGKMMGKGDKTQHNGCLIITHHKAAFYRKGIFGEILKAIPLKNITSVDRKSTLGHRVIKLDAANDHLEFKGFSKKNDKLITEAIENGRNIDSNNHAVIEPSGIDKIKQLGELKEQGLITEQEFEDKKTSILATI